MRTSLLLTCSVLVASVARSAPVERADRVERVVVFADRAEVTRAATARCEAGAAAVSFPQLPDSIDARTLRGEADGDAVPVGVSTTTVEQTEALDARVKELQDETQRVDVEMATLQRAQADDDERLRSLASYGPWFRAAIAEDLRQPKPDVARYEQLLGTLTNE